MHRVRLPKASSGGHSTSSWDYMGSARGRIMTATGGALGEARWAVGRLRPLVRYAEGRPDRGMPRLGGHDR